LTKWQTGNGVARTGGASEEAGGRQLRHILQLSMSMSLSRPANAGEATMSMITAPKTRFFMELLSLCPGGFELLARTRQLQRPIIRPLVTIKRARSPPGIARLTEFMVKRAGDHAADR
jgi:hypothetical protein